MKALIISGGIPTTKNPLRGIFAMDQAKALASAGVDVILAAVDTRSIRRFRKLGITHGFNDNIEWYSISIPLGRVPIWLTYKLGSMALLRLYNHIFHDGTRPDIIHAHFGVHSGLIASTLARKIQCPLVITEHYSKLITEPQNSSFITASHKAYQAAYEIITVSSPLAKRIHDLFGINCTVIHNIIDTGLFSQVKRNNTSGFGFITTGSLNTQKNHTMLLDAFAKVHSQHKDTRLGIIGGGELEHTLKAKSSSLGIDDSVTLYGQLERQDIARIYDSYDCFVFPSLLETFGVALAEAMSAGLPVIATRCGGPEDFVRPEAGMLIAPGNLEELTDAMMTLYDIHSTYDGKAIRAYTARNFSPENIARKIIKVYERVCNAERG